MTYLTQTAISVVLRYTIDKWPCMQPHSFHNERILFIYVTQYSGLFDACAAVVYRAVHQDTIESVEVRVLANAFRATVTACLETATLKRANVE